MPHTETNAAAGNLGEPIDRQSLVTRHNPHIDQILPMSPLHLGNGSMVFTADFTGLQTFPQHYDNDYGLPIQTVAGWAWNRFPNSNKIPYSNIFKPGSYQGRDTVSFASNRPGDVYYRSNTHRFNLGRIGLDLKRENGESYCVNPILDQTLESHCRDKQFYLHPC